MTLRRSFLARFLPLATVPALLLAACSGSGGVTPNAAGPTGSASGSGSGFAERMTSMVFGPPARPGTGQPLAAPVDPECPPLDVRQGASTITIYGSGERSSTNVRYQATVGQLARECRVTGASMTVKLGLQGRVILGPVGGPGRLDIPIRFALVREGPEPRTIWTQLYRVAVDVPQGQTNVPFVHIEDNISFPTPPGDEADAYVFYVGFDAQAQREPQRRRRSGR